MFSCVLFLVKSKELTPPLDVLFLSGFCRDFGGTRDQGCVPHLIGEGKPRHPSHLRKALTCFYLLLFVAMLVRVMSLPVTVTALPLHSYRYRCYVTLLLCYAILLICHAILVHSIAMPCHVHV